MDDYDKSAIQTLSKMLTQHQEGTVFITEKIAYVMSNVTKRARKNYLGIYDEMLDRVTKDEKYFPPLTESFSDAVIKSVDIDTKDIDVYSRNSASVGAARVMRILLKQYLHDADFGTAINRFLQYLAIDGHGVLKFVEEYDQKKKRKCFRIVPIDTLNLVVDPTAESMQDGFGVLERSLMTDAEMRRKKGVWKNTDDVQKTTDFTKNPTFVGGNMAQSTAPYYVVWDYWGQIDKSWVTKKKADEDVWVEGHLVVTSLQDQGSAVVLFAELNETGVRPYGDAPLQRVIGRWQGRGVPEKLFGTQKYLNALVNIRKKNAMILQQGLFKAKRGLGLTADSILSKITVGGIVQVDDMDDFQQLPVNDTRAASYADEDRLIAWGERNTGANDIRRGEAAAASAPATQTLVRDRNSRDLFQLVQENVGMMLEDFMEDLVIPWIVKNMKTGDIVSVTGNLKDLEDFDSSVAEHMVNKAFDEYVNKNRVFPSAQEIAAAKEAQLKALRALGNRRYVQVSKKDLAGDYGIQVTVTNDEIDKNLMLGKLQEILTLSVTNPGALNLNPQGVLDSIFDLLDIPTDKIYASRTPAQTPVSRQAAAEQAAMASQPANSISGTVAPQSNAQSAPSRSQQAQVQELTSSY